MTTASSCAYGSNARRELAEMLRRHSSRREPLASGFLNARLEGAASYDRIAGYFSSSILEIAGEALERVAGPIRVVCNSALSKADVEVAKAAQAAMRREWCGSQPELLGESARPRFRRLHQLLRSGKLEVRVLPDNVFGLIHGKAGVIEYTDGRRTSFLGSANESRAAFELNYELIWEDEEPEAVVWVQEEFDALWNSPFAVALADFVVQDLDRLSRRKQIEDLDHWRNDPDPASAVVEAPVYREAVGLWEHQKQFVKLAFRRKELPTDFHERWDWLRNPLPDASEDRVFELLRRSLSLRPDAAYAEGKMVDALSAPDRQRINDGFERLFERHNPYIRNIVRRTREQLEGTIDPETGEPYLARVEVRLHGESSEDAITLPPYLRDAYNQAESFCALLATRANVGFFHTMLLRRIGSTIEAGRLTVARILEGWPDADEAEDDDDAAPGLRTLTEAERRLLTNLGDALAANNDQVDPKCAVVSRLLVVDGWLERGCIVFSQYYDSIWWLAAQLAKDMPDEDIGIYASADRSGVMRGGTFERRDRDALKDAVQRGSLRLVLGTDAVSEGLNLQRLGTLINLDLPWNPSRLEQRKGRIQRIGQVRPQVDVYNMRYAKSVEDRVHELLSSRLEDISRLFGQLPDTLEDVWVHVALGQIDEARKTIDAVPMAHPFELRYRDVSHVDWESCARVLRAETRTARMREAW